MNKSRIILITVCVILLASLAGMAGYLIYKNIKNISQKNLNLNNLSEFLHLPDPLTGPKNNIRAENLAADKIIDWTNKYRVDNGLKVLAKNDKLTTASQKKLIDEFSDQYFAHVSPKTGKDVTYFVGAEGYQYALVGENLALGDFTSEKDLVDAWMASPGHRENILKKDYTEIGVAAKLGEIEGRLTWLSVQIFAKSQNNCSPPDAQLKVHIEQNQAKYNLLEQINNQIQSFQNEGQSLMDAGNNKIKEGNEIYARTKDQGQAKPYWDEAEKLYQQGKAKMDEANKLIDQANEISGLYETLKNQIENYNSQVEQFNKCIGN